MAQLSINAGQLDMHSIRQALAETCTVKLAGENIQKIKASQACVNRVISEDRVAYGINTGFGLLARTRIPADELETLQQSIVLSHAAGVGEFLDNELVRLIMVLKINSLARGFSGVRMEVIEGLQALLANDIYPCIPAKGSVGASGDLAPLAHMAAVLLGEGQAWHQGKCRPAAEVLQQSGLKAIKLAPKEGLALLNGTQVSTALALRGLLQTENAIASAIFTGAMSLEAARGSRTPFDPRIHEARGHQAQIDTARAYLELLQHSQIEASHRECGKVQDPYSLRCQPQVMGACLEQMRNAARTLVTEANAVSDNPLVFADDDDILSGGNFHAEPVAMAADNLALALAETGALAERRIALLIDSELSGLPPFLVENGGLNSGFMIAQVSAAALASENKSLAHPASVDSLPTSANQEDHVSMATFAARRLRDMYDNTSHILAIELLMAAQGMDFHRPLKSSTALEEVHAMLRKRVPFYDKDRYFAPDIALARELVEQGVLLKYLQGLSGF